MHFHVNQTKIVSQAGTFHPKNYAKIARNTDVCKSCIRYSNHCVVIIFKNSIERKFTHLEFFNVRTCPTKKSKKDNYRHKH